VSEAAIGIGDTRELALASPDEPQQSDPRRISGPRRSPSGVDCGRGPETAARAGIVLRARTHARDRRSAVPVRKSALIHS
jgi:hypothetical protein